VHLVQATCFDDRYAPEILGLPSDRNVRGVSVSSPISMPFRKRVAMIAHDNRKEDLLDWAEYNRESFMTAWASTLLGS
jgi:hypothetical protein